MKLISQEKQTQIQWRIEVASAAILSTVLVSVLFVLTDPGFSDFTRTLFQAGLQSA